MTRSLDFILIEDPVIFNYAKEKKVVDFEKILCLELPKEVEKIDAAPTTTTAAAPNTSQPVPVQSQEIKK